MDGDPSPDVSSSTKSSKKKKTAPAPTPVTPVNVVVEDLGPNEIRIETPVASEDTPPTAPKKKTKHVGFSGIDDDVQGLGHILWTFRESNNKVLTPPKTNQNVRFERLYTNLK